MLSWSPNPSGRAESSGGTAASATQVPASATVNTKGAWTLVTTPAAGGGTLHVSLGSFNNPADFLVDIGKSTDGTNVSILLPDLHVPNTTNQNDPYSLSLPLRTEPGVGLYARVAATAASDNCMVGLTTGPGLYGAPGFARAVTLFTPATSRGIAIDPGAAANTKGTWTSMTTGVGQRAGAVFGVIGSNGTVTHVAADYLLDVGVGASGAQFVVLGNHAFSSNATNGAFSGRAFGPFPTDIPASTAVWARAQCSVTTATSRLFDLSLYGMVA
jgi:hypothetical protein